MNKIDWFEKLSKEFHQIMKTQKESTPYGSACKSAKAKTMVEKKKI